jgi:DNA replication protein DnaC
MSADDVPYKAKSIGEALASTAKGYMDRGYTATPPDPAPCPKCKGAQYRTKPHEEWENPYVSEIEPCPCTRGAIAQRRVEKRVMGSGLEQLRDLTFDRLLDWPEQRAARAACRRYAENPDGWLVLHGDHGTGKTTLAVAIGNVCIDDDDTVVFKDTPLLLETIRATYDTESEVSGAALLRTILDVDLLILDDFGKESETAWVAEKLFTVTNYRWLNRLPTVITTNIPPDQMTGPVASRITDSRVSTVIRLEGDF